MSMLSFVAGMSCGILAAAFMVILVAVSASEES
jgi:hypothetical protein